MSLATRTRCRSRCSVLQILMLVHCIPRLVAMLSQSLRKVPERVNELCRKLLEFSPFADDPGHAFDSTFSRIGVGIWTWNLGLLVWDSSDQESGVAAAWWCWAEGLCLSNSSWERNPLIISHDIVQRNHDTSASSTSYLRNYSCMIFLCVIDFSQ
jgi:hypothetical protein